MIVDAVQCKDCLSIVFSRARHDFRSCVCQSVSIDGGRDYVKLCGDLEKTLSLKLHVAATSKELYDDWNLRQDRWGLHHCIEAATGEVKPPPRRKARSATKMRATKKGT